MKGVAFVFDFQIQKPKTKNLLNLNLFSLKSRKFCILNEFWIILRKLEKTRNMRAYYHKETLC